jgi:hypothetical protein
MLRSVKTKKVLILFLALVLSLSSVIAIPAHAETASDTSTQANESSDKISMDVRNADIRDVLSAIAITMGNNIIYIEAPMMVDFSVQNVAPSDALSLLLRTYGMDYIKLDSTLIIGLPEKLTTNFANNLSLTKISLKYIQSDVLSVMIDSLGIDVKKIFLDTNRQTIWVQGLPTALAKVRELVNMLDRSENASAEQNTSNYLLTSITLNYITAEQMNNVLQSMGLFRGIIMDGNPKTLWVYADKNTLNTINQIKEKIDVAANAESGTILLKAKKMNFLTANEVIPILMQLGIDVNPITFPRKSMTVWLNGSEAAVNLASSVIDTFDIKDHINDNVFYVHKLVHITAKEAQSRLEQLNLAGVTTYTFAFPEFTKSLIVFCPSDYKLFVMSHLNNLDISGEKIKVPIDYSDVATGMSRLQQRRDLLANLTGVTTAAFTISTNVARDDGFHYIMYLEETPDVIQRVKDMIKYIDSPLGD